MISKFQLKLLAFILPPIIICMLLLLLPIYSLSISPDRLSIEFNMSDPNREQIESLTIKNMGPLIENVQFSVKGPSESFAYFSNYINYFNQLKSNLTFVEKNISMLNIIITEMNVSIESINQSIQSNLSNLRINENNLNSTIDNMAADINELYLIKSNNNFLNGIKYIKLINSTLENIDSNISHAIASSNKWTNMSMETAIDLSVENVTMISKNFSVEILTAIRNNMTVASNQANLCLNRLNPEQYYILISLLPNSIQNVNESETLFASVDAIILNNTRIGSYRADILMLNDECETIASIPLTIKVASG